MEYLVYLAYPAMALILFWGAGLAGKGKWNDEFMNLSQTKYFQGFIAICIMLHHIGQEMCGPWQSYPLYHGLDFFVPLGFMFVAVFMFFSGYGLYLSYETKPGYVTLKFLKRKSVPLLIGFFVSGWAFMLARWILGETYDAGKLIGGLIGYLQPNPYCWFALVMPMLYLLFYLVFKFCRHCQILIVIVITFIYQAFGMYIGHNSYLFGGEWWYNSVQLFWVGLLVAKYRKQLYAWAKKLYWVKLAICILGLGASWELAVWTKNTISYYAGGPITHIMKCSWICLGAEMLTSTIFVFTILLLGMKIKIGNRVMGFFGTITFEYYIVHGLVVELFSYRFCDSLMPIVRITNGALMIVVVTALSIPLALGMKKICRIVK